MFVKSNHFCRFAIGLLPIFCLFVSTQSASATCGDYVHILRPGEAKIGMNTAVPLNADGSKVPCPCRGPECHQSPTQNDPIPTTPTTTNSNASEAILLEDAHPDLSLSGSAHPESIGQLQRGSKLIFHPPRNV